MNSQGTTLCLLPDKHLQLDDMWMSEEFQVLYFPLDLSDDIKTFNFLTVKNLDCHLRVSDDMLSNWNMIDMIYQLDVETFYAQRKC